MKKIKTSTAEEWKGRMPRKTRWRRRKRMRRKKEEQEK